MATPDPPRGSGTVTVASQGAAAFVGDVYYLADGRTGDPILGWPPRPPPVGFSRGDARDADDGPDLNLNASAQEALRAQAADAAAKMIADAPPDRSLTAIPVPPDAPQPPPLRLRRLRA